MKEKIAVVVIGRNEGERLRCCLESVAQARRQVNNEFELIYVDSASTDNSVELAGSLEWSVVRLDCKRLTAAMARNAGWRSASAEWILFLDGDTVLHPDFLQQALRAAQTDPDIAAVWGHRREMCPEANLFHRVLDLDWVYPPGDSEFCGGDALFRGSALLSSGGFDDALIAGEEPELCSRLRREGWKILHIDAPMTLHNLAISGWGQYWKRASRAGYAYAQMAWRTRRLDVKLWATESRANVIRAAALCCLLALLFVSGTIGVLSAAVIAGLCLRSAWRSRWKSNDKFSLLTYGVHSQLQHLPIFAGQLAFFCDLLRNRRRLLIEYK